LKNWNTNFTPRNDVATVPSGGRVRLFVISYILLILYVSCLPLAWDRTSLKTAWWNLHHLPMLGWATGSWLSLGSSVLFFVPLGFLLSAWLIGQSRRLIVLIVGTGLSLLLCAAMAFGTEFFQQFFPPRVVSLNDVCAEFAGGALGVGLWSLFGLHLHQLVSRLVTWRASAHFDGPVARIFTRRVIAGMAAPYFFGIAWLNGWFSESWQPLSVALARLPAVQVLPFYYQSNAETPAVLLNLVFQVTTYWPVGVATWIWWKRSPGRLDLTVTPALSGLVVATLAFGIEFGKLFLVGREPSVSNVLLAFATATTVHWLLGRWYPSAAKGQVEPPAEVALLMAPEKAA